MSLPRPSFAALIKPTKLGTAMLDAKQAQRSSYPKLFCCQATKTRTKTARNEIEPHIAAAEMRTWVLSRIGRSHTTDIAFFAASQSLLRQFLERQRSIAVVMVLSEQVQALFPNAQSPWKLPKIPSKSSSKSAFAFSNGGVTHRTRGQSWHFGQRRGKAQAARNEHEGT